MRTSNARLVPGEIMATPPPRRVAPERDEVVDAEFETIGLAVAAEARAAGKRVAPIAESRERFGRPGGAAFWSAGVVMIACAFWFSGGHTLTDRFGAASASRLAIGGVKARVDRSGAKPMLAVDGHVRNDGGAGAVVGELSMQVTAEDGSVIRYRLGTTSEELAPGQQYAFSSRLDVPRSGVKAVAVHFAN
jgi:hypothetical protein